MTWEIRLIKWKQKKAKKEKEKKFMRMQKEDLKDAMQQLYQKINFLPERNSHFIHCSFPETAEKLKAKGFNVEFDTKNANCYWYTVSWKE